MRTPLSGHRVLRGVRGAALILLSIIGALRLEAQRLIDYTPNTRPVWTMENWQPALVLSHRFELIQGGDELVSIPTITVGTAVRSRVAVGLDFTSNSEASNESLGRNETQYWIALGGGGGRRGLGALLAYNSAVRSIDGALTARARLAGFSLIGEARAFSDAFGTGDPGFAGAVGTILHLTPYFTLNADVGRALSPDSLGTTWSGAFVIALPGTRHQFSFLATNTGATTLQGASRKKVIGPESVRYGFAFIAPLGTAGQWARIFRGGAAPPDSARTVAARVDLRDMAFSPREIRIRAGQSVEWLNNDPTVHTVTADDRSWGSEFLPGGARYSRTFDAPGRYPFHCNPHPHMRGVVIVEAK